MVECTKNLYEILNVPNDACKEDIKLAYKKLVRLFHPDINKSKNAEIEFKLLNSAYEVLGDDLKRKEYDKLLSFAPKKPKEDSIIKNVKITEFEAKKGGFRTVNILNTQKCPKCMGKKFLNGIKCAFCLGEGEKQEFKKIEVEIPENVENNSYIYVGKVNSSALYDKELFLKILIEQNQKLYFEDDKIIVKIEIPVYDAILGTKKEISIENKLINLTIPGQTKPNTRIKLDIEGNYYATIGVIFPETISNEEKTLYDKIRNINLWKKQ